MDKQRNELGGFLSGITYGVQPHRIFMLIYGPQGVGKSTFPSSAPEPIYIDLEASTKQLAVPRLPQPATFEQFNQQLSGLQNQEHPFQTLVVDSLGWLEQLIQKKVCGYYQVDNIEDAAGGYGKGHVRALGEWREVLDKLSVINRRMHVVLICHSKVKRFEHPYLPGGFDRFIPQLNELAAGIIQQAVDAVLFANFVEKVKQVGNKPSKSDRGVGDGERILFTERRPAFDAKNRFNLPFELPLQWADFAKLVKEFYTGPAQAAAAPLQAPDPAASLVAGEPGQVPAEPGQEAATQGPAQSGAEAAEAAA